MNIEVYLFLNGRCDEALDFYKKAIGAEVGMVMRYNECPDPLPPEAIPPGFEDKVMHCSFKVGETTVMASDGNCGETAKFDGFGLALNVSSPEEADQYFNALSEGGQIVMPIDKTFFSPRFGMVKDKFDVQWMINTNPAD